MVAAAEVAAAVATVAAVADIDPTGNIGCIPGARLDEPSFHVGTRDLISKTTPSWGLDSEAISKTTGW